MSFFDDFKDAFGFGDSSVSNTAEKDSKDRAALRGGSDDEDFVTVVRTQVQTIEATFDGDIGRSTFAVGGAPIPPAPRPTGGSDEFGEGDFDSDPNAFPTDSPALPTNADTGPAAPTGGNQVPAESSAAGARDGGSGGGSNTAAKVGIAIGVLAAIFIVGGLLYFAFMRRKKKQTERQSLDDDEKLHGPLANPDDRLTEHAPEPPAKAPRVSLQRVSLLGAMGLDKRMSKNAAPIAAAAVPSDRSGSGWERPFTSQSQNPANPFGNHAERMQSPIPEEPAVRAVSPLNDNTARGPQPVSPLEDQAPTFANAALPTSASTLALPGAVPNVPAAGAPAGSAGSAAASAAGTGVVVAGAAGLTRNASRNYGPKPLDLTVRAPAPLAVVPPSPARTEYSVNSVTSNQQVLPTGGAAAIAAAGGPPNSTVHRVQLDFKPTLEDELGLRAGDLVRLLHEYDDGWALVIRLDRSRQGVAPRTCLSTRPVKPRPNPGPGPGPRGGPPVHPNGRPMTPQGYPRPQSPAARPGTSHSNRSVSPPNGHAASQGPQPASPANGRASPAPGQQARPQSPGPRYQTMPSPRPQSPSGAPPKSGLPGPSPMGPNGSPPQPRPSPPTGPVNRKPVPGQGS